MLSSSRGQKTHTLTQKTLTTLGLLGLLSAGLLVGQADHAAAIGCGLTGDGDADSPYLVEIPADLAKVGVDSCALSAHYRQTNPITLTDPHTPIGGANSRFTGTFDGGGKTITGLTVVSDGLAGLFGATDGAMIRDIHLVNVSVTPATENLGGLMGSIVGQMIKGSLLDSSVSGEVEVRGRRSIGGLVGETNGSIARSTLSGVFQIETTLEGGAGGIVGQGGTRLNSSVPFTGASLEDVAVSATGPSSITSAQDRIGGIAGVIFGSGGLITKARVTGELTIAGGGTFGNVGGLIGDADGIPIEDSTVGSGVTVLGSQNAPSIGGFVGLNTGTISNSFSFASVNGSADVGGFVGSHDGGDITNSYSAGTVTGTGALGGFAGVNNGGNITNSFWDTQRSGLASSDGGTGKTTGEMTSITTFDAAGWGIIAAAAFGEPDGSSTEVWGIGAGLNCGYPFLYWQTETGITCEIGGGGTDSSQADGSTSASGSSPEKQASAPAIHLDLQATVGQQVAGTTVVVGGQGLASGSTMTLVVRSTPQTLVRGTVSSLGNFSTKINLPALASGSHTLTLSGTAPDGSLVTLTQGFTISATGTFSALGTVAGGQTTGLAVTGPAASVMWSGIAGLGLLFAGLALTAAKNGLRIRRSL